MCNYPKKFHELRKEEATRKKKAKKNSGGECSRRTRAPRQDLSSKDASAIEGLTNDISDEQSLGDLDVCLQLECKTCHIPPHFHYIFVDFCLRVSHDSVSPCSSIFAFLIL
ncbi:hypothetical protein RND81_12G227400 [Saponaria officinalis]|uniref:Uncharacterized protein n=1 Tax=Saponaria officinalis TaxID=3572 RepID=A0AAW1HE75_SAPOF